MRRVTMCTVSDVWAEQSAWDSPSHWCPQYQRRCGTMVSGALLEVGTAGTPSSPTTEAAASGTTRLRCFLPLSNNVISVTCQLRLETKSTMWMLYKLNSFSEHINGKLVKGIDSLSPLKKEVVRTIEHVKNYLHILSISALILGFLQKKQKVDRGTQTVFSWTRLKKAQNKGWNKCVLTVFYVFYNILSFFPLKVSSCCVCISFTHLPI